MTPITPSARVRVAVPICPRYSGCALAATRRLVGSRLWTVVLSDMPLGFERNGVYWAREDELEVVAETSEGENGR